MGMYQMFSTRVNVSEILILFIYFMNNILLDPFLYLASIGSFSTFILIKYYILNNKKNILFIFFSMFTSFLVVYSYFNLLQMHSSTTIIFTLIKIISVIIEFLYGLFVLNYILNTKKVIGIILAILSIYLLSY